jgi:hypothetical protein
VVFYPPICGPYSMKPRNGTIGLASPATRVLCDASPMIQSELIAASILRHSPLSLFTKLEALWVSTALNLMSSGPHAVRQLLWALGFISGLNPDKFAGAFL